MVIASMCSYSNEDYKSYKGILMQKHIFQFSKLLWAVMLCAYSPSVLADNGRAVVYYDCKPSHSLYVKAFFLEDITPTPNEHTILLDQLTDKQTRECQITSTDKVIVQIGVSLDHPRNDNVSVFVNNNWLGTSTFDHSGHEYTYIVTNIHNASDVTYIDAVTNRKTRKSYLSTNGQ